MLITRNTAGSKLEHLKAMFCSDNFMMTKLQIVGFLRYWRYHISQGSEILKTKSALQWHFCFLPIENQFCVCVSKVIDRVKLFLFSCFCKVYSFVLNLKHGSYKANVTLIHYKQKTKTGSYIMELLIRSTCPLLNNLEGKKNKEHLKKKSVAFSS